MKQLPVAKVLLVDDLEENLIALEALLRHKDLQLLRARSGREALELLLAHDVALALLDVQMPDMDGFELAELMRGTERTRRVPIVFLTAGTRDAKRVFRGYEVGAVDFLFKPLDPVLLGHKVATFVELHRQRLERARLAEELRAMLRPNEMFVSAVSHDLRSPLSSIIMGTAILERDVTDPDAQRTLARMRSSAERAIAILEELSDLARARLGGGLALDRRDTDLRPLVEKALAGLRASHPERSLLVTYDAGPTTGVWDDARLEQVLLTLAGNALRHGDADKAVEVRVRGAAPDVIVEVHNAGAIPPDLQAHLFDPFRPAVERVRESVGLGLYLVQQIVLAHGGTIELSSSQEAGTTFVVELPRSRAPA
jgi:signal transduction histidine kinase